VPRSQFLGTRLGLAPRRSVCSEPSLSSHHEFGYSSFSWSARARALVSTPALAAARSSYRPAAKAHARIAELLSLHPRTDPPCSHRRRVALEGTSSPYTAMSTSGQGAVLDRMDTTSHPSPGSQGDEPPPPPGPRDEAGAADEGNRPGASHALVARSASGKEAVEKARKASPVWEPRCFKNAMNLQVAPRGAWHQNQPIGEKRRIPRIPHQASPAACCGCSQQR